MPAAIATALHTMESDRKLKARKRLRNSVLPATTQPQDTEASRNATRHDCDLFKKEQYKDIHAASGNKAILWLFEIQRKRKTRRHQFTLASAGRPIYGRYGRGV